MERETFVLYAHITYLKSKIKVENNLETKAEHAVARG